MLDWLKEILGEHYTEDIDKKVGTEIGKRFVTKADFNTKNEELKEAQKQRDEANQTIEGFKAMDIDGVKKSADEWKEKFEQAQKDADARVAAIQFDAMLDAAITAAKGRSPKAVKAMLDVDTLRASKNQDADIKTALEALQKDSGYLFGDDQPAPPPYAGGTGGQPHGNPGTGDFNFGFAGIRARPAEK